ncbi:MAG: helix-turn-helix domain-containing protein [Pseudomonadota bacterium]
MDAPETVLPDPTQREEGELARSSGTRRAILEAAMDLLAEEGYANLSAGAVAKRAGLTRAALIYHFANRAALTEAAILYITRRRIDIYQKAMATVPRDDNFIARAIDQAWDHLQDRSFAAFCELSTAARTNPELDAVFSPALLEYDRARRETALKLFPESLAERDSFDLRRDLTRFALEGLAQQGVLSFKAQERRRDLLNLLKLLQTTEEGEALLERVVSEGGKR